jgi:PAS domain-containing protein
MDTKQRVQFDFSPDVIEILDLLKGHTDVSTRADAVRNAIRFHYEHLPSGPRKLVWGTAQEVPQETQRMLAIRLEEVARCLANVQDISFAEVFNACLSLAKDTLYELGHIYDPPINPMTPEIVIATALCQAMKAFHIARKMKEIEIKDIYNVTKGGNLINYDSNPEHHGERDFEKAADLAVLWLREGHIVRVFESACEVIKADKDGVIVYSRPDWPHRQEHDFIANVLKQAHQALYAQS